jgi:hypothetical protein
MSDEKTPSDNLEDTYKDKLTKAGELAKLKIYQDYATRISSGDSLRPSEVKQFLKLGEELGVEPTGNDLDIITSYQDAARYCGVSTQTINANIKRGHITQRPDGTFSKKNLDEWIGRKNPTNLDESLKKAELRFKRSRAKTAEIMVKVQKDQLISQKEVNQKWAERVGQVVSMLEMFCDRLPPLLEGKSRNEMRDIIKREVYLIRDAYGKPGKYTPRAN